MSARFYRNPDGTGFAGGLPWVLAKGGAPERRPRGPAEQGSGSGGDAAAALMVLWDARIPLRGRIFLWKTLLRPPRSRPILPQPGWDGALQAVCLVRLLAKGGPPRGGLRSTRVGDATTALMDDRAAHPATGSHLPSEATAPPFAVAFASSPFAHPIPQSRRRASGDLFSGSLRLILCHSPCPSDSNAFVLYHVFFA